MGVFQINQNPNLVRLVWLNAIPAIVAIIILNYLSNIAEGKYSDGSKKKVVIVGEMSDLFANESSRTEPEFYQDYDDDDYADDPNHNRMRRGNHVIKSNRIPQTYVRRKSPGSVFVPVAAYSITKSKTKPSRSSNGYRKRHGGPSKSYFNLINLNYPKCCSVDANLVNFIYVISHQISTRRDYNPERIQSNL